MNCEFSVHINHSEVLSQYFCPGLGGVTPFLFHGQFIDFGEDNDGYEPRAGQGYDVTGPSPCLCIGGIEEFNEEPGVEGIIRNLLLLVGPAAFSSLPEWHTSLRYQLGRS